MAVLRRARTVARALACAAAALLAFCAQAKPVSAERAARAAENWSAGRRKSPSGKVRTFSSGGRALFHLVEMEGGGFVAMSGDDTAAPVIGFSQTGALPSTPDSGPLWTLLSGRRGGLPSAAKREDISVPRRARRAAARRARRGAKRKPLSWEGLESDGAQSAARTLSSSATSPVESESALDEVIVAPMLKSKWDQSTVGGKNVYNLYTPGNRLSGCVATAMAQLMRYHEFPRTAAARTTRLCGIDGYSEVQLTTSGTVYDWNSMPLSPDEGVSDAEREAIGRLCSDAGIAVNMCYAYGESSAFNWMVPFAMTNVFGYSSAHTMSDMCLPKDENDAFIDYDAGVKGMIENGILANLDAGFPVIVGLYQEYPGAGHSVVADGYGYSGGTLFCHLNMGWSGACDFWYAVPQVEASGYSFDILDTVEYNIFPEGGDRLLLTGRVFDCDGAPAADATVTATYKLATGGAVQTASAQTSPAGVYALRLPVASSARKTYDVSVSAAFEGRASTNITVTMQNNVSPVVDPDDEELPWDISPVSPTDKSGTEVNPRIGNSWGNDLDIQPAECKETASAAIARSQGDSAAQSGYSISFSGTPKARYTIQWRERLDAGDWIDLEEMIIPAGGAAVYEIPADGSRPSAFFRIVPSGK